MTTSLTRVRKIKAQPATVYEALTQPDLIARWWGPDAGPVLKAEADVRIGGAFRVRFRMLNGDEHESHGIYREVVPEARLVFTWQWVTMDDPEIAGDDRAAPDRGRRHGAHPHPCPAARRGGRIPSRRLERRPRQARGDFTTDHRKEPLMEQHKLVSRQEWLEAFAQLFRSRWEGHQASELLPGALRQG